MRKLLKKNYNYKSSIFVTALSALLIGFAKLPDLLVFLSSFPDGH